MSREEVLSLLRDSLSISVECSREHASYSGEVMAEVTVTLYVDGDVVSTSTDTVRLEG